MNCQFGNTIRTTRGEIQPCGTDLIYCGECEELDRQAEEEGQTWSAAGEPEYPRFGG